MTNSCLAIGETLEEYWPINSSSKTLTLIPSKDKTSLNPKRMMTVESLNIEPYKFELIFSNKPGQLSGHSDIEVYELCKNSGGDSWLFLTAYINRDNEQNRIAHAVESTKILFTPLNGHPIDLMANGTYSRCGAHGQPYLLWNQRAESYRIQVWGVLAEDRKYKWYWDAIVSKVNFVENSCLKSSQSIKSLKVKEAWWSNFKVPSGKWVLGSGDMGFDGQPSGFEVAYGRTVWHGSGQLPYYLIGEADKEAVYWCINTIENN